MTDIQTSVFVFRVEAKAHRHPFRLRSDAQLPKIPNRDNRSTPEGGLNSDVMATSREILMGSLAEIFTSSLAVLFHFLSESIVFLFLFNRDPICIRDFRFLDINLLAQLQNLFL